MGGNRKHQLTNAYMLFLARRHFQKRGLTDQTRRRLSNATCPMRRAMILSKERSTSRAFSLHYVMFRKGLRPISRSSELEKNL